MDAVALEGTPGWEIWPENSSTIVSFWVKPPKTLQGSFWGSKEMVSPACEAGAVRDSGRIDAGLKERPSKHWGQGPRTRRMRTTSACVRVLYGCFPVESSAMSFWSGIWACVI
jgi:hypothetical protein